jgi:hypothetical protein
LRKVSGFAVPEGVGHSRAAEHGPHPSEQDRHAERFHHIVVRTRVQRFDRVLLVVMTVQDDDRCLGPLAETASGLHPIDARQADSQQDQIRLELCRGDDGVLAPVYHLDDVIPCEQLCLKQALDLQILVDDQDALLTHRNLPSRIWPCGRPRAYGSNNPSGLSAASPLGLLGVA